VYKRQPWGLGLVGAVYGVPATLLSLAFLAIAFGVWRNRAEEPAAMAPEKRLFRFSLVWLAAIFALMVADRVVARGIIA
jgi:protoheme IX farnesyltransferase